MRKAKGGLRQSHDPNDYSYKDLCMRQDQGTIKRWGKLSPLKFMPPVFDQGQEEACSVNSSLAMVMGTHSRLGVAAPLLSRNYVYWYARRRRNTEWQDTGAQLRDVFHTLQHHGAPIEPLWPYTTANMLVRPPADLASVARKNELMKYYKLDNQDPQQAQTCLGVGFGFAFLAEIDPLVMEPYTGGVLLPPAQGVALEDHDMVAVEYYVEDNAYLVQNSWGNEWGQAPRGQPELGKGFCIFSSEYMHSAHVSDGWTVRA